MSIFTVLKFEFSNEQKELFRQGDEGKDYFYL